MEPTTTLSVIITLTFQDGDTRNFKFNGVDKNELLDGNVQRKVKAINANMPADFATTFISNSGAQCIAIGGLKSIETTEEVIYSAN